MSSDNFKVKCIKATSKNWHVGGIYKFKNGTTIWDNGKVSSYHNTVFDFLNYMNDSLDWFIEYKEKLKDYYTVQDILLTDKFKDGQEFRVKIEDDYINENVIYRVTGIKYLEYKESKVTLGLYNEFLTAKFYPVSQFKKTYIDAMEALKLIQQGKEVWCEIDDNIIKFNNPKTKKIQISHVLKGKWYVME